MAKSRLKAPIDQLESDIIETLIAGHHEWRPDLNYPESYSDMQGAVRGLLRVFDVKRRPLPINLEYYDEIPKILTQHFKYEWQDEVAAGKTQSSFEKWVTDGNYWRNKNVHS